MPRPCRVLCDRAGVLTLPTSVNNIEEVKIPTQCEKRGTRMGTLVVSSSAEAFGFLR